MKKSMFLFFICALLLTVAYGQEQARLLRFPAMHGSQVVFTYAGDLYTVEKTGGVARKLTGDVGFEMFARFSPDGQHIAFTGQYDGNTEVYVMPARGGKPERLTWTATLDRDDLTDRMGPNNIVMTWKDNNTVVFRSRMKSFNDFKGQLFAVAMDGSMPAELPLPCGGFCSYSPDGTKLAFNRVFREFRTWKYYRGGMADDIWIYDFASKKTENITNNTAQDIFPMWKDNVVYFLSDRDRIMNLWSYNTSTGETQKITNYTEYDIKFPSLGTDGIVYENGGYLYFFDFASRQVTQIQVFISDDQSSVRMEMKDASKNVSTLSPAPDGKRLALGARGDVFTVPSKSGITRNLTQTSGVHERSVAWSPDGKYIAYISDATGEDEIYIALQDGSAQAVQLTKGSDTYKYAPKWSPDSKKLLWSDKLLRLQYVDVDSKIVTLVATTKDGEFHDFSWAPDSKKITYVLPDRNVQNTIYIYDLAGARSFPVTDGWYSSGNPVFSPDGNYLYFTSNRDFNPTYSWTEWNHIYKDMTSLYMVTLAKSTANPFGPENDEVAIAAGGESGTNKKDEKDKKKDEKEDAKPEIKDVAIDAGGIVGRIIKLPVPAGAYWGITPVKEGLYYCRNTASEPKSALMFFDLKDKKENNLGEYGGFSISADGKKMLISDKGKFAIVDLPKTKLEVKEFVDLGNMKVMTDLKAEWMQIFNETWRQMRDFFYAPNMHGVDWPAIRKKYEPLAAAANHRADLSYVLGEMIGELNAGHAYIGGGDKPAPERIKTGLLGAVISHDASGHFRIDKILKGENWTKDVRSPLTEVGVNVKEGDYIIAVNGVSATTVSNIYELMINTAGKQVELTVNSSPSPAGALKTIVTPLDDEADLYYYNWVQGNIKKVSDATDGKVGYIHIPNMGVEGLNEFVKYYYPQLRKKALIIDDRGNGGGNVSPMIIERLSRELVLMNMGRNQSASPSPGGMHFGPKICLIDNYSASDGDLFPYRFRELKLGRIVGVRSWGGVVGIRGSLPFIDGGTLNKPEFAHFDKEGKDWIIEGYGVDPDIVVDNDPAKEYAGEDEQLNRAIQEIIEELKGWPENLPDIPDYPDKSR